MRIRESAGTRHPHDGRSGLAVAITIILCGSALLAALTVPTVLVPAHRELTVNSAPGVSTTGTVPSAVRLSLNFTDLFVNIFETGLPINTSWSAWLVSEHVSFGGGSNSSEATFGQQPANGSWMWEVSEVPGYVPYPASGVIQASTSLITIDVTYLDLPPGECSFAVAEWGLPLGTTWWAAVGSFAFFSNGSLLYARTECGNAEVTYGSDSPLTPAPPNATLPVFAKEGDALGVTFLEPASSGSESLSLGTWVALSGTLIFGAALGFIVGRRQRIPPARPPDPPPPWDSP